MKKLLVFLLPALFCGSLFAQNFRVPISNYTNKTYGRNYESTNYCILTDHRNLVYTGNANGVLEYDGTEWRFIPVRQGAYVTSMDISPAGTIFIGSQQEFGLLVPNQVGSLHYNSLSDHLDEFDRFFTTIWSTHAGEYFVAFQAEECLYILQEDSIRPIYPETSFHTSFLLDNTLYVRERESGLKVFRDGELQPVPDGNIFADLGIFGMFENKEEGHILIITNEKGFFLFDPVMGIEALQTGNDRFLAEAGVFGGIELDNNYIALHTMYEGVIVCDPQGKIVSVINKSSGLRDNDVKDLWKDAHKNIWCALGKGISKIDYSSPVSFYHESAGLEGSVHSILRYRDRLFVGTTTGLYAEREEHALNQSHEFVPYPGIRDQVWDLAEINGNLVIGTSNGAFRMHRDHVRPISDHHAFALNYLEEENLLLIGGNEGLAALDPTHWKVVSRFPGLKMDIKSIAVNHSSLYEEREVWLGTSLQGVVKLLLKENLDYEIFQYYGPGDGLPEDWVLPFEHKDSVVFGTRNGILQFNDEKILREMVPDSLKDRPEFYRGYFEISHIYGAKSVLPHSFITHTPEKTWAIVDNQITLVHHDRPGEMVEKPFMGINLGELNYIYPDTDNIVWFGASEGLARFDAGNLMESTGMVHAAIRSVIVSGDSLIFNGTHKLPEYYSPDEPGVLFEQPADRVPVLDHQLNDLTFFFTAPYYDNESANLFSWRLEGRKDKWSNWSTRRITSYTNLKEGEYAFLVRMKNIYGDVSSPTGFSFIIRPPWFRTWPAYIAYLVLSFLFVYTAVRLGQYRLRKKNERLEAIVEARTEEIRHQNIELAAQKKEITDSIYYAERIQRAILPSTDNISSRIDGYFILFKPKDIVSGDFYWIAENGKKIIVTAVDCTGHGVPGAFMSMLGVSFLNKIILENNILEADRILNELRDNVINSLKQTGKEGEARDGMDMALLVIDLENMAMEYAGANNPLYMIREEELNVTKADRMPIAFQQDVEKFTSHRIQLNKGDSFFIFSDGYADQFGGPRGKKFMYKPFKNLLFENRDKPMDEIHKLLDETIESWKSPHPGEEYEQVDDILVIGVRI